ncbi:unnamed protein product [Darwinula stevensoni]|uniref:Uncharacterized protein n=1 Tax=Darwinula stevensoni TaxID=69355 RepID=A0A7R8X5M7_9CRUS|nr:unnamed protein product [Darwinula stevensoni]CAG0886799.1 unnamed protein product [Darwinula stevensoni]
MSGVSECATMAAIPLSVHTAVKVHRNMTKKNASSEEKGFHFFDSSSNDVPNWHSTPVKEYFEQALPARYNSKLMNSIWGLYNRYSPHNFKKNNGEGGVVGIGGVHVAPPPFPGTIPEVPDRMKLRRVIPLLIRSFSTPPPPVAGGEIRDKMKARESPN